MNMTDQNSKLRRLEGLEELIGRLKKDPVYSKDSEAIKILEEIKFFLEWDLKSQKT